MSTEGSIVSANDRDLAIAMSCLWQLLKERGGTYFLSPSLMRGGKHKLRIDGDFEKGMTIHAIGASVLEPQPIEEVLRAGNKE